MLVNILAKRQKKIPIRNYRFVQQFDENRCGQNKDYGCTLLCDVKTTDKIENDLMQKQIPMLYSKIKITDKNLSKYQLDQIREKRKMIKLNIKPKWKN